MARESLGFVGGLRTTPTQRTTREKTYFVFNDIDLKRVEGSSALIGEHTSSTPFQISPWRRATAAELSRPNRHSSGRWLAETALRAFVEDWREQSGGQN